MNTHERDQIAGSILVLPSNEWTCVTDWADYPCKHKSVSPIILWDVIKVSTLPADGLAPLGARPSAGNVLTTELNICCSFIFTMFGYNDFEYIFADEMLIL